MMEQAPTVQHHIIITLKQGMQSTKTVSPDFPVSASQTFIPKITIAIHKTKQTDKVTATHKASKKKKERKGNRL
jgi:hypothetical protein